LKIPFPNERTGGRQNATGMSNCEDKPHTCDDRMFLGAADRYVKEGTDTEQGYKKEKPAKRWQTSGGIVFVESDKYNGENGI